MTTVDRIDCLYELQGHLRTCRAALLAQGNLLGCPEEEIGSLVDADAALDICALLILDEKRQLCKEKGDG